MNNFWRVVRMAMRFRVRYALAVFFALIGAASFGTNIAALLPVMKVLLKEQTLQEHMAQTVETQAEKIQELQAQIAAVREGKPVEGGQGTEESSDARADLQALTLKLKSAEFRQTWDQAIR
jgi:hypothetical protein